MRNLDRPLCLVVALALAAASPMLAQQPAEPQAPQVEPAQPAPEEPRPAPAMSPMSPLSDSARIALCKKKGDEPLEDRDAPPSQAGGTVTRPEIIHRVAPRFRRNGAQGTIVLEAVLDEDGCVRQVRVLKSLAPKQDAAALAAVRQWVFRPATFNGEPVRVYYSLTVNYTRQ